MRNASWFSRQIVAVIALASLPATALASKTNSPAWREKPAAAQGWPERRIGIGGRIGGFDFGIGASVRFWNSTGLGLQVDASRYSVGYSGGGVDVSSAAFQIAPSLLYAFRTNADPSPQTSIRPYVGGGVNLLRTSLGVTASGIGIDESSSDTRLGYQGFGGVELGFKRVPKLGISGEIGYYSTGTTAPGLTIGGVGITIAAHWYFR